MHGAEDQVKVPDVHPHLHAIGVAVAVVVCVRDLDGLRFRGLLRLAHRGLRCDAVAAMADRVQWVGAKGGTRTPTDCSAI